MQGKARWSSVAAVPALSLFALFATACATDDILMPETELASKPLAMLCDQPTDEPDPDCDEGDTPPPGGDGSPTPIGWAGDLSLYDSPGDPSPGAPGVWLGAGVTAAACLIGSEGTITSGDADADGFKDSCEYAIARAFAPLLQFHSDEECGNGQPYWAAKGFRTDRGVVASVAYMPAYYRDCYGEGHEYLGHSGDSEMITVSAAWQPATQHWQFTDMWTSAHWNSDADRSRHSQWSQVTFPVRARTFPVVWVASAKHANYPNQAACWWYERCETNVSSRRRFPVDPMTGTGSRGDGNTRNVGSPFRSLVTSSLEEGCVSHLNLGRTECFFRKNKPFNGWQPTGDGVTSYYTMLTAENHFEVLSSSAKPDHMNVQGPDWIDAEGTYYWNAPQGPNVNHVWEYSTNQINWYSYNATTYVRNVFAGDPSFWLRVKMYTNGILVGTSYPYRVIVNICSSDVDWCAN